MSRDQGISPLVAMNLFFLLNGEGIVYDAKPKFCLMVTRQAISEALEYDPEDAWTFHNAFSCDRVEGNEAGAAWARSTQRTMRDRLSLMVPFEERIGGDLVFSAELDPKGHVGVLLSRDILFENTASQRGAYISGFNRLSNLIEQPHYEKLEVMRLSAAVRAHT